MSDITLTRSSLLLQLMAVTHNYLGLIKLESHFVFEAIKFLILHFCHVVHMFEFKLKLYQNI